MALAGVTWAPGIAAVAAAAAVHGPVAPSKSDTKGSCHTPRASAAKVAAAVESDDFEAPWYHVPFQSGYVWPSPPSVPNALLRSTTKHRATIPISSVASIFGLIWQNYINALPTRSSLTTSPFHSSSDYVAVPVQQWFVNLVFGSGAIDETTDEFGPMTGEMVINLCDVIWRYQQATNDVCRTTIHRVMLVAAGIIMKLHEDDAFRYNDNVLARSFNMEPKLYHNCERHLLRSITWDLHMSPWNEHVWWDHYYFPYLFLERPVVITPTPRVVLAPGNAGAAAVNRKEIEKQQPKSLIIPHQTSHPPPQPHHQTVRASGDAVAEAIAIAMSTSLFEHDLFS